MKNERICQFDLIKFICCILIVFHHFQQILPYDDPLVYFYGGDIKFDSAVEMFFLLSGILTALHDEQNANMSLRQFLGRKYLRLFPMTAISITAFVFVAWLYNRISGGILFGYCILSVWDYLICILMIASGGVLDSEWPLYNSPTWYVDVLLICYLAYYICHRLAKKLDVSRKWLFFGMIFAGLAAWSYGFKLPFFNGFAGRGYVSFFTGVLLVSAYRKIRQLRLEKIATAVACCIVAVFLFILFTGKTYLIDSNQQTVFALVLFPAILWLVLTKGGRILFSHGINRFLGGLSFQIYLWHCVLIGVFECILYQNTQIPVNDITMLVFTLVLVILCIPLYALERKIDRFVRKMI